MRDSDALDELRTALAQYRSGLSSAADLAEDMAEIIEATGRRTLAGAPRTEAGGHAASSLHVR